MHPFSCFRRATPSLQTREESDVIAFVALDRIWGGLIVRTAQMTVLLDIGRENVTKL